MRNEPLPWRRPSGCWAIGYPALSDRHPVYMYGVFSPALVPRAPGGILDQAMLGIREEAGAAPPDIHPHRHPNLRAGDSHRFMFGVAPEQEPVVPPEEPVFCFWDA